MLSDIRREFKILQLHLTQEFLEVFDIQNPSSATQPVWGSGAQGTSAWATELCYTPLFQPAFSPDFTDQSVHSTQTKN